MQFKIDENLPRRVAAALRDAGHDAETIGEQDLSGADDPVIADVLRRESRALVTLDLDFADIRAYPPPEHPGIIVLRPHRQDRDSVLRLVTGFIPLLEQEPLAGHLWIVDETRVRVRGA